MPFSLSLPVLAVGATVLLAASGWWWQQRTSFPPATPITASGVGPSGPAAALVVSTLAGRPPGLTYFDGPVASARFSRIGPLARDAHGNLYVAGTSEIRKISPDGRVSTVAGAPAGEELLNDGTSTTYGDYGPSVDGRGAAARIFIPGSLVAAPDGTLYFTENNTIRRVSPQGQVTTWAGRAGISDEGGYRDGPAAQALFDRPAGLVLDAQGTLLVADQDNHVIRQISPAGRVSTLAGQPGKEGYADGVGAAALFYDPRCLALLPDGSLLVAETGNGCLRRVSRQGLVSTWAGTATNRPRREGPGAGLDLDGIQSLAVDAAGAAYFIDNDHNHMIRRILPDRTEPVSPWAGQQNARAYADADTPTAARFNFPDQLLLAPDGTLYVADVQNHVLRSIAPDGRVRTVAGEAPRPSVDGPGAVAQLEGPSGLALDPAGNLLVADRGQHLLRRISPAGQVSTVAGRQLVGGESFDANRGVGFYNPAAVAVGPGGTIYVADEGRHLIQKVNAQGQLSYWAGQPGEPGADDAGLLGGGHLNYPVSVAVAADGSAYSTDRESRAVRRIAPNGRISTFEGGRSLFVSPFSNEAHTYYPTAVALGPDGALYVLHGTLRRYPPGGGRATLLAGDAEPGYVDGLGAKARFNYPTGLAVDAQGNVFVADRGNHLIRRVSPQGEVTTVAGQPGLHKVPQPGKNFTERYYGPDNISEMGDYPKGDYRDGPAQQARFNHPTAVAVGPDGTLYVADQDNNCIRTVRPAPAR